MDAIQQIRRLYYEATADTVQRDLARAVELLKTLPDEEARERATVYMEGLAQMRTEWALERRKESAKARVPRQGDATGAAGRGAPRTGKPPGSARKPPATRRGR
jgi:hypothetical protein